MAKKVLIVDDEDMVRGLVKESLREEGYELHEAANGGEALEKAKLIKPDLVILDLMMPDKWGYLVCDELKKDPDTSGAVIMFLTARGSAPSKKMAEKSRGDDFMVKPFSPAALREKVNELLSGK